jgi:hypothetical protein
MIRTLILSLAILATASPPAQARGGGHGSHGGHGHSSHHHRHHHFHHFSVFPFSVLPVGPFFTQFPYGYPCWWDEGHWVGQVYEDKYGNSTYVPEWVPGRWKCLDGESLIPWESARRAAPEPGPHNARGVRRSARRATGTSPQANRLTKGKPNQRSAASSVRKPSRAPAEPEQAAKAAVPILIRSFLDSLRHPPRLAVASRVGFVRFSRTLPIVLALSRG